VLTLFCVAVRHFWLVSAYLEGEKCPKTPTSDFQKKILKKKSQPKNYFLKLPVKYLYIYSTTIE